MSSILSSVVLAATMVVSGAFLFLAFSRQQKSSDRPLEQQTVRSCLCWGKENIGRKKKRVKFAEHVTKTSGNGEEYRRKHKKYSVGVVENFCSEEIQGMPANRVVLYNGILRDRVHRIVQFSY